MITIDVDRHWRQLKRVSPAVGAIPRRTRYGDAPGLLPFGEAMPDKLPDPRDYKEIIAHCHKHKIFPMYHSRASWRPQGFRWNQNGLNYCWAWAIVAMLMTLRKVEKKKTVLLSPVAMGWLVRWLNQGNYLDDTVRGLRERGVPPMSFTPDPHSRNSSTFLAGWQDEALLYRLADAWDTPDYADIQTRIRYMIALLSSGTPDYVAWHWWGHATGVVGVYWDESVANNLRVVVDNSHNEDDFIELIGNRAIPDEQIGLCSTLT